MFSYFHCFSRGSSNSKPLIPRALLRQLPAPSSAKGKAPLGPVCVLFGE